jgi:hypothetical protein
MTGLSAPQGTVQDAPRSSIPWLALVSNPRSGTTHVIRLMEALAGLNPCREEWLNSEGVPWVGDRMLERIRKAHGVPYEQFNDITLGAWARADPARMLDFVQICAPQGTRVSVVKVLFPDLTVSEFETLFLTNSAHMTLIMQRAPIDSFISFKKAHALDKWLEHDTTDMRVTLDADAFIAAWTEQAEWYRALRATLEQHRRPYGLLHYDRDILPGEDRAVARLIEELARAGFSTRLKPKVLIERQAQRMLATAAGALRGAPVVPRPIGLQKQDRAASREAKVANWGPFLDAIRRQPAGEAMLDSYGVWD